MRHGVGPADDGLHFEHALDRLELSGRGRDLAFGDDSDDLGVYLGQDGARMGKDAVEHVNVNAAATVEPVDLDGKGKDDLILHYPNTKGHRSEVIVLVNRGPW